MGEARARDPPVRRGVRTKFVGSANDVVDRHGRTSHPDIYAAGDVAFRPLVHYGREGRLESVHNAIEGGKIAAAAIVKGSPPTKSAE